MRCKRIPLRKEGQTKIRRIFGRVLFSRNIKFSASLKIRTRFLPLNPPKGGFQTAKKRISISKRETSFDDSNKKIKKMSQSGLKERVVCLLKSFLVVYLFSSLVIEFLSFWEIEIDEFLNPKLGTLNFWILNRKKTMF